MHSNDGDSFNLLAADTAISVECEGIDYVFAAQVVGRLKQWLVITRDPAMDAFDDQINPGCRLFYARATARNSTKNMPFS